MTGSKSSAPSTRTEILREASRLFNERGYHGTSVREVASAVGIRKQSVSHHFPTKQSILEELLGDLLHDPLQFVLFMRDHPGSPAARLWAYVRFDVTHLRDSPYVLQGLVGTYLLKDPTLVKWYQDGSDLYDAVAAIIAQGVSAGEFRDVDPDCAAAAVGGLVEQTFSVWDPYGFKVDVPVFVADFSLSALLRDSAMLDQVKEAARALPARPPATATTDAGNGDLTPAAAPR